MDSEGAESGVAQYGMLFDQRRCNGCKTCQIACMDYHDCSGFETLRTVYEYAGGSWRKDEEGAWEQDVFCYHLSLSCGHCSNPLCVRICSAGAVSRDSNGFVQFSPEKCKGCQQCLMACPYHAPRFDEQRGVVVKCDGCTQRVSKGHAPICVEACPQRALLFGPFERLEQIPGAVFQVPPMPSADLTQPNYLVIPCDEAKIAHANGEVVNLREI